jgi:CelD/BcsL family acetyltransferase involved in cellulose biosynthesis
LRGTSSAEVEVFSTIDQLSPDALTLLDEAPGIFMSRTWWGVVLSHAMPAGAKAAFMVIRIAGRIAALLPMLRAAGRLDSLTTPYTCEFRPLFAAGRDPAAKVAAMTGFGRFIRSSGVVRMDALPAEWDGLAAVLAGARQAGLRVLRFDHFGNWQEDVSGLGWSEYLRRRPGAVRETVRRRVAKAGQLPGARFELFSRPEQMDNAAEAFASVYRRSWKEAEPYPTFNEAFMRAMAARGLLRLGVWSVGSDPVAVQMWIVQAGDAWVLKLAHDHAYRAHSPGTVLTASMLRYLLNQENVRRIDFGRGDDAYKRGWATQRRQHIGLLLTNPWRANGAAALARHFAGRACAAFFPGR